MSAMPNLRSNRKCGAHAFDKRLLRQTFVIALGLGLSIGPLEANSAAQYNAGDLPGSPWSKRTDAPLNGNLGNTSSGNNVRLRQPGFSTQSSAAERRSIESPTNEIHRPAPVKLMGPILPSANQNKASNPSDRDVPSKLDADPTQQNAYRNHTTASPKQALTQKQPIEAQSDWQRLQAGGLVLEAENTRDADDLELDLDPPIDRSALVRSRRIGSGLPDRSDDVTNPKLPSQTASSQTVPNREEPFALQASNAAGPYEATDIGAEWRPVNAPLNLKLESASQRSEAAIWGDPSDRNESVVYSTPKSTAKESAKPAVEVARNNRYELTPNAPPNSEIQMQRIALAQKVHHELLSQPAAAYARAPEALESLPGWQALKRELELRLERCDSLLKRGVVLSAREEASQGLLRLYRTMDLHRGSIYSEPAFEKAIAAFKEEADFLKMVGGRSGSSVQSIVDTHSTEALKNRPLDTTSPEMAAMHYRWYARYQLATASDGHVWAADLLYAYGKTLEKDAELSPARANMYLNQAVACYQAATQVAPNHSDAANQLGFVLIHLDRTDEAYTTLAAAIQQNPTPHAWNNMAEVLRQKGAINESESALQIAITLAASNPNYGPENPQVTELEPTVFAKYSPMPQMVSPGQNARTNNPPAGIPVGYGANAKNANSGKSLWSKILGK